MNDIHFSYSFISGDISYDGYQLCKWYGYMNKWLFHFPSTKHKDKNRLTRNVDPSINVTDSVSTVHINIITVFIRIKAELIYTQRLNYSLGSATE